MVSCNACSLSALRINKRKGLKNNPSPAPERRGLSSLRLASTLAGLRWVFSAGEGAGELFGGLGLGDGKSFAHFPARSGPRTSPACHKSAGRSGGWSCCMGAGEARGEPGDTAQGWVRTGLAPEHRGPEAPPVPLRMPGGSSRISKTLNLSPNAAGGRCLCVFYVGTKRSGLGLEAPLEVQALSLDPRRSSSAIPAPPRPARGAGGFQKHLQGLL